MLLDHMLTNPALRMTNCCNELNTGYAADGYARSHPTKVAVVVVTYMVGSLSILNAIAGAYSEGLRVIVICGGPESGSYANPKMVVHHSLGLADKGQSLRMFEQVTCASICLGKDSGAADVDRVLQKGLDDSRPVYIEIPVDLSSCMNAAYDPGRSAAAPSLRPAHRNMQHISDGAEKIQDAWQSAKSPIVVIGGGARHEVSRESLDELVRILGCVVFYLPDGKSLVSETIPQCGGLFWSLLSDPGVESTVKASDLWITIGCRWNDLHTLQALDLSSARLLSIQNDNTIRMPDGHEVTETPMQAVVDQLIHHTTLDPNPASHTLLTLLRQNLQAEEDEKTPATTKEDPNSRVSVDSISEKLTTILKPDDTVLSDAGQSWFTASQIRLPPGAGFQVQLLYASTGWSLPASMGCQSARRPRRVFAVIGDGSLQMVCQELSTMARNRINAVVVVINNCGYQVEVGPSIHPTYIHETKLLTSCQDAIHKGPYNEIGHWDYISLVEAMWNRNRKNTHLQNGNSNGSANHDGHRLFTAKVKTQQDLDNAVQEVDQYPQTLAVLECCVDPNRMSSALQKFGSKLGHTD